jgi:hypothetical protein
MANERTVNEHSENKHAVNERRCPHCDTKQLFEVKECVGSTTGSRTVRCINEACRKPFFVFVAGELLTGPLSQPSAQT